MTVRVTVEDTETGDNDTAEVVAGDYLLTTVDPCELTHVQKYANGTVVLTIKNHAPQEGADVTDTTRLGAPAGHDVTVRPHLFVRGFVASCACGWTSGGHVGPGDARAAHRDHLDEQKETP